MQVLRQRTYSVEMTEEELRLFSEFLEERQYNSPEQKALRKAYDYNLGVSGTGRLSPGQTIQSVNQGMGSFGNNARSFIQDGRAMANSSVEYNLKNGLHRVGLRKNINKRINAKVQGLDPKTVMKLARR